MNSEMDKFCPEFESTWGRICIVTGWENYSEFAEFLKIKSPSVSGAKKRGMMPFEWIFKVARRYNCSTDWLATGEGPMMRGETNSGQVSDHRPDYVGPAKNMSFDTPGNRDPDLMEIVEILENDPESKDFVLMILRGRKQIKAGMAGLGLKLQND